MPIEITDPENLPEGTVMTVGNMAYTEADQEGAEHVAFRNFEINRERRIKRKIVRERKIKQLTVTTTAGNTFDADKESQSAMVNNIAAMDNEETIAWVLSDNSEVQINKAELKEALRRATRKQTQLIIEDNQ